MRDHGSGELGEVTRVQLLRTVAERELRILGDLDDDPVRAHRGGGARKRLDQAAVGSSVGAPSAASRATSVKRTGSSSRICFCR